MITALFWVIIAAMTLAVVATLVVPILRNRPAGWRRDDFNRQVYRDQLRELELDVERGVITADEAEAARVEIQRRLIATGEPDANPDDAVAPARGPVHRAAVASLAILVPTLGLAIYVWIGNPGAPGAPPGRPHPPLNASAGQTTAQARPAPASGEMSQHELDENIAKLRARLTDEPNDIQGWLLLARSLTVTERHSEAAAAYQKAFDLDPGNIDAKTSAAEALVLATGGRVTPEAETIFRDVLSTRPNDPASRYYIALGKAQAGAFREAFDMWRSLLLDSPPDAPWRGAVAQRVRDMAERLELDVATVAPQALTGAPAAPAARPAARPRQQETGAAAPRGPSAEDMAAAAKMSPEERQQMIRGMVEGLAERLQDEPNDSQGWQRLVRVYGVLGEPEKAYATMDRALANLPAEVGPLLNFAGALMRARGSGDPFPDAAVAALKRILEINPQNPGALYFMGQVQAEAGETDKARATWQQLLERLDPASPSYATVKKALEMLNSGG